MLLYSRISNWSKWPGFGLAKKKNNKPPKGDHLPLLDPRPRFQEMMCTFSASKRGNPADLENSNKNKRSIVIRRTARCLVSIVNYCIQYKQI